MTQLLFVLWDHDPLLVMAGAVILLLLAAIQVQSFRMQVMRETLGTLAELRSQPRPERSGGCLGPALLLLLFLVLLLSLAG